MTRKIEVFEHENLTIYPNSRNESLSKSELDKLYSFNDSNGNKFFTGIRDGIKFGSYVGVIQVGNLTLEILPKADKFDINESRNVKRWQAFLVQMLNACRKIKIESVSESTLRIKNHSLLDLYFSIFLDEVEMILRKGLVKKYRDVNSNISALKGSILFKEQIQYNLIHKERFYCRHKVYDCENIFNQIIYKALITLKSIKTSSYVADRLNRLLLNFPVLKDIKALEIQFRNISYGRNTRVYENSIKISRLIIFNYSPDVQGGNENLIAILFDMNKLWEEYILLTLLNNKTSEVEVTPQESLNFWGEKTIRPDIVIRNNDQNYIIDTKWKVIEDDSPSDSDLKQMYAYNMYWNATRSLLVYPLTDQNSSNSFIQFERGRTGENGCKLYFAKVCDQDGNLHYDLGKFIFETLQIS